MEIKNATVDMAQQIIDYVKLASGETANLLTTPEEFTVTLEQEQKHIQSMLEGRLNNQLVAMEGNQIVGLCGLHGRSGRKRVSHVASVGITVLKSHWGQGIGYALMKEQERYAKENGIAKINLEVRTDNQAAINLYLKCGYEKEGINKRSMLINGEYIDTFYMGLCI